MRRRGKLEAAADHGAVQCRDHRRLAELDLVEGAVPHLRMRDALRQVALFEFGEIEPGGEMLAVTGEQHGADAVRQRGEERVDAVHGVVVERVALVFALEPQDGDGALPLGCQR